MDKDFILEILKNEYGINTLEELEKAIEKQEKVDISCFCGKRTRKEKEYERRLS